jgi:hypothetical protein
VCGSVRAGGTKTSCCRSGWCDNDQAGAGAAPPFHTHPELAAQPFCTAYACAALHARHLHTRLARPLQFKHLLADECPRLSDQLLTEGVEPALYATHWFNTAFSYTLPFDHLLRVWDVFMLEGMKVVGGGVGGLAAWGHGRCQMLAAGDCRRGSCCCSARPARRRNLHRALPPATPSCLLCPALLLRTSHHRCRPVCSCLAWPWPPDDGPVQRG